MAAAILTREIPLENGGVTTVDSADYVELVRWTWRKQKAKRTWYVSRTEPRGEKTKTILMHRQIAGVVDAGRHVQVDHFDGDGLNNRRGNLRLATQRQNSQHQIRTRRQKKGTRKGVHLNAKVGRWVAQISAGDIKPNGQARTLHLGTFATEDDAARRYDSAAMFYFGDRAALNFPEEIPAAYDPNWKRYDYSNRRSSPMKTLARILALLVAFMGTIPATAAPPAHNLVAVTTTATGTTIPTQGVCVQATVWSASTSTASVLFEQSADGTTWSTMATFTDPSSTATSSAYYWGKYSRLRVDTRSAGTISGDIFWAPCTLFPTSITSFNNITFTKPASTATFTLTAGKTFAVAKTLTLTGTDSTTHTFPSTNSTVARTDAGQTFTGTQVFGTATASRFLSTGTAPTVANVGADSCGTTAASIAGKDQAHVITVGATSGTECRVTFNVAFANAPVCVATGSVATDLHLVTTTTTATITGTLTAAEKLYVHCLGY